MSGTKVKICGVTRPGDARLAAKEGAWAIGLIFYPRSPRFVTAEQALEIVAAIPAGVLKVGVFMDSSAEVVRRVEAKVPLDLIQLHGRGAAATAGGVGFDRVILAVAPQSEEELAAAVKQPAAHLLVDRHRVAGAPSGVAVNWPLARRLAETRSETLLAGALTPESVGAAMQAARPWGVDVSSGVESAPGVKDAGKMRAFIEAVWRTDAGR